MWKQTESLGAGNGGQAEVAGCVEIAFQNQLQCCISANLLWLMREHRVDIYLPSDLCSIS